MAKRGIEYMKSLERRALLDVPFALGALAGTAVLAPALVPAAMVASRSWRVLYYDERGVPGGPLFEMCKFQTIPPKEEGKTREITGRHHPEASRLGNAIRQVGLDELPQAWHILTGDMSAVGPRPVLAESNHNMRVLGGQLYQDWLALQEEVGIRAGQLGVSQLYRRGHPDDTGGHALRTSLAIDLEYYGKRATLASDWALITRSVGSLAHLSSANPMEIVERFVGPEPFKTV
jgi:lipopolysaccharide/colanic/teichoic acid biosynthesis glycosyltransferase